MPPTHVPPVPTVAEMLLHLECSRLAEDTRGAFTPTHVGWQLLGYRNCTFEQLQLHGRCHIEARTWGRSQQCSGERLAAQVAEQRHPRWGALVAAVRVTVCVPPPLPPSQVSVSSIARVHQANEDGY